MEVRFCMESRKLLLIINPVSGRLKIGASLLDILKVFSDAGYIVTVQTTRAKGDATRLVRELGPGHDLVVLSGGDGTLNEGVEGLMEGGLDIPVGYIPCGTTNDFAASLGIERENLRQAAENIVNGKVNIIDVGLFGRNRYFSYIASFGAFTGTSYSVPQTTKNVLGHLAYVLEGVKEVPNIRPINAKVSINGEIIEENAFIFGSVSNATSIGGIVKLDSNKVDFSDGMFEVMLVKKPRTAMELSKAILGMQTGDYTDSCITMYHADSVSFEMENVIPWTLDGEFGSGERKVDIRVKHNALKIVF